MKSRLQTREEKERLFGLYLEGKLNPYQLDEFLKFLQTEEGQKLVGQSMDQTGFSTANDPICFNRRQSNKIYQQINKRMKQPNNHFKLIFRVAASFLLLVALGWGVYYANPFPVQSAVASVQVFGDQQQMVILPDGTHIRLNAGSQLRYPSDMNKQKKRQVTLIGEAFFEVARNPEKPFIIDAGKAEVRVLGTVFNVKTMCGKNVVVAVQEGKVFLKGKKQDEGIILIANEVGILEANENVKKVGQSAQNYFSWFEHFLEFENVLLPQVVEQLEVIFDTDIELSGSDLNNKYFTAYMKRSTVDEAMNQLALSLELKLKKIDGKYFLKQ